MTRAVSNLHPTPGTPGRILSTDVFARFQNVAEWWHSLDDVPLERIVTNPRPGTATEHDLLRMVENEDRLVELVDGTLVEKPVGWMESQIAMRLIIALGNHILPRKLGALTGGDGPLMMRAGRIRLPDITFVSVDDVPPGAVPNRPVPQLPPTLAVEVISESNTAAEMRQKLKEYFESGSRLVWLIYPKTRTVAIFERLQDEPTRTLPETDVLDGGTVLPGFSIAIAEVFEPLSSGF